MIKLKGYSGILFVGDPHLWSSKPGKRIDLDFTGVVLDKIDQAVEIALRENLYLVFLGDLFHVKDENNLDMITKLTRILNKLKKRNPCATVEGNHEKTQTKVSDDVALGLMEEAGTIYVMGRNSWWGEIEFDNMQVYIGSTPYGSEIPREVTLPASSKKHDKTFAIWLTHHSLAFEDTYPGAVPVHCIKGVDMLVNGHIHETKKPMVVGTMVAHNPGNITRLSTNTVDHIPAVWVWKPEQGTALEPINLIFQKNVFKITEEIVIEERPDEVKSEELTPIEKLRFVEDMKAQMEEIEQVQNQVENNIDGLNHDQEKTADGSEIKVHINAMSKATGISDNLKHMILNLVDEAIEIEKSDK